MPTVAAVGAPITMKEEIKFIISDTDDADKVIRRHPGLFDTVHHSIEMAKERVASRVVTPKEGNIRSCAAIARHKVSSLLEVTVLSITAELRETEVITVECEASVKPADGLFDLCHNFSLRMLEGILIGSGAVNIGLPVEMTNELRKRTGGTR